MSDLRQTAELARIEAAYRERDARSIDDVYRFAAPGYRFYLELLEWSLLECVRHSSAELERSNVLDVGCGSGYFVSRLLEFGAAAATGVDLMPARIEAACRRYPQARFVQANAAELPFGDGAFDIVTQLVCLSSVLDPGLRAAIAAAMWRVLRPGGIVVSYDIRPEPAVLRMRRRRREQRRRMSEGESTAANDAFTTPTVGISAEELRRLFPEAGLQYATAGLDYELCAIADRSYLVARLLACLPALRAHGIAVLTKPTLD